MQVILLQRVEKLGKMGDLKSVKPGYFRNFLFPKKMAALATAENIEKFDKEKVVLEQLNLKHKEEAELAAKTIDGLMVVVIRQAGESGHLYGSVTSRDVAEEIQKSFSHITRQQVQIDHPIKTIGIHRVRVILHPEVHVTVSVNVAKSEDEAKSQTTAMEEAVVESKAERIE